MSTSIHPRAPGGRSAEDGIDSLLQGISELVRPHDVVGTLTRLLDRSRRSVRAASAGLVIRRLGRDDLELLASTHHTAAELELYQVQSLQGPCIDAATTGEVVHATGSQEIRRRWPDLAPTFLAAGYVSVRAIPLSWYPDTIGALNVFWDTEHHSSSSEGQQLQIFAHLATLALVNERRLPPTVLVERTRIALAERTLVEQAKGVLAHQYNVGVDEAFGLLMDRAATDGIPVRELAEAVIGDAISPANAEGG